MKIPAILKNDIGADRKEAFEEALLLENLRRGRLLAYLSGGFECVLIGVDLSAMLLRVDSRFAYVSYLLMYGLMILASGAYLLLTRSAGGGRCPPKSRMRFLGIVNLVYITFVVTWGGAISLMDQRLYGHIVTFMINMSICSVAYLMDNRKVLLPYGVSTLLLAGGLPFFQSASDVLVGHYVNLSVFVVISWLVSRILYHSYCENYAGRSLLTETNRLLEKKNEEIENINIKLTLAYNQLKQMSLLDDLTGIPNRKCFREFIDKAFASGFEKGTTLSVIMLDVDFFKQYNDHYGHETGDRTLAAVAAGMNAAVKSDGELLIRWGGEEFIYAAFNKSREEISRVADTLNGLVADLRIAHAASAVNPYITVSQGVCTVALTETKDVQKAVRCADQALYLAKNAGRNCVRFISDTAARPAWEWETE